MQLSTDVRSGILDPIETVIGASPVLKLRTGAAPANCAAADSGTELLSMTLPSDWLNVGSGATKTKKGVWQGTATVLGTFGHYRIYESTGTSCKIQGPSSELVLADTTLEVGQPVRITAAIFTAGNA